MNLAPPLHPAGSSAGESSISAQTTREEFIQMLARAGISDLETFVRLNLEKAQDSTDDAPTDESRHVFIHRRYVCIRDSTQL